MKNIKVLAEIFTILVSFLYGTHAVAQDSPPVKVTVWGMHHGGALIYNYQVDNLGVLTISNFFIGFYPPTDTADGAAELTVAPDYPGDTSLWLPASVSQSPAGWGVFLSFPDESTTFALRWVEARWFRSMWPKAQEAGIPTPQNPPNIMPPGASWNQFSVTLSKPDIAYVQGHANMFYGDKQLTVQMVKGDTIPPALTVSLSPASLLPPNNKLRPVTANIRVNDDFDPEPEIKLESITANEPLDANDIQDARLGTDDRSFSLAAKRTGNNQAGRIYTVTYSATDASGNKATASAAVIVPYDQGK